MTDTTPIPPETIAEIQHNLKTVSAAIHEKCKLPLQQPPRLVAVSKTKTPPYIRAAYDAGHRCFGENYVQELCEKAPLLPPDISWHFIGHLQTNKAKDIIRDVPNLAVVETVDSDRIAQALDKAMDKFRSGGEGVPATTLDVFIQVNTSGEDTKNGVEPGAPVIELAKYITTECKRLRLKGLMTIGMPDYTSKPENFTCLMECRRGVANALGVAEGSLELSMGMSGDYLAAVEMGSTNVRVGSAIFGSRTYPTK
eukprot:PhF_6_TR30609/c1_g1_i2/m.45062/K06997/yggS, PROSC; PLP dependent protein